MTVTNVMQQFNTVAAARNFGHQGQFHPWHSDVGTLSAAAPAPGCYASGDKSGFDGGQGGGHGSGGGPDLGLGPGMGESGGGGDGSGWSRR